MQQRAGKSASRPLRLQFELRKRGRAVEGTGLENRRRGNSFVSSNLTASANTSGFVRVAQGKLTKTKISTIIRKMQDGLFCYLSLICLELSFKQLVRTTLPRHLLLPICAPVNCQHLLASPLGSFNMRA